MHVVFVIFEERSERSLQRANEMHCDLFTTCTDYFFKLFRSLLQIVVVSLYKTETTPSVHVILCL